METYGKQQTGKHVHARWTKSKTVCWCSLDYQIFTKDIHLQTQRPHPAFWIRMACRHRNLATWQGSVSKPASQPKGRGKKKQWTSINPKETCFVMVLLSIRLLFFLVGVLLPDRPGEACQISFRFIPTFVGCFDFTRRRKVQLSTCRTLQVP